MSYAVGQSDQRPWGSWEVIDIGSGFAVKRILVLPGHRVSLQRHQFRSEHWVIVQGEGMATSDTYRFALRSGDNAKIAQGVVHRIENIGNGNLVFIEVQFGERLDEDDIQRFEDDYGRTSYAHQDH